MKKAKITQIILELIYLKDEFWKNGRIDRPFLKRLEETIQDLRYYKQFIND